MATEFTIKASPGTDVWRKPPTTDVFNAPRHPPPSSTKCTSPLSTFHSARISFILPPTSSLIQYDQAGLILSLNNNTTITTTTSPPKWIKTGVEIYNNLPRAATVACDTWSDWSLATVISSSSSSTTTSGSGGGDEWVTVEVVSGGNELGRSLWVYQVVEGEKIPLREVCWPFGLGEGWEVTVEAYACRPNKEAGEELSARFRDFEVAWS